MASDLLLGGVLLLIGVLEIVSVWFVNRRIKFEHDFMVSRGTLGEQLGEFLMEKESDAEDAPMMIDVLALRVGRVMFNSQKASAMQELSVDSRKRNQYSELIHAGVKKSMSPYHKALYKIAEELGLDLDEIIDKKDLPAFLHGLRDNGIDGTLMGAQSQPSTFRSKY